MQAAEDWTADTGCLAVQGVWTLLHNSVLVLRLSKLPLKTMNDGGDIPSGAVVDTPGPRSLGWTLTWHLSWHVAP